MSKKDKKKDKKKQLKSKSRSELVVKANDIIRNSRYSLTVQEQKLIIYLISKITKDDTSTNKLYLSISEYCEITGIEKRYKDIKNSISAIRDKSWWIKDGKTHILFSWLDTAKISENSGTIEVCLSKSLEPYLVQLKQNFTAYQLDNILVLKSKYAIRLYELFKSYEYLHKWECSIDVFRDTLELKDVYPEWRELKRNVIDKAIKEINTYTDLNIECIPMRLKSRKYDYLIFNIQEKRGIDDCLEVIQNQAARFKD